MVSAALCDVCGGVGALEHDAPMAVAGGDVIWGTVLAACPACTYQPVAPRPNDHERPWRPAEEL
jgi:hypothetical protein